MRSLFASGAAALAISATVPAEAARISLDLSGFSDGFYQDGLDVGPVQLDSFFSTAPDPGVSIDSLTSPDRKAFCFNDTFLTVTRRCIATGGLFFDQPVRDPIFSMGQSSTISDIPADAFDEDGNLLKRLRWFADGQPDGLGGIRYDFTGVGPVAYIVIYADGDFANYYDLSWDDGTTAPIPAPAAALLFIGGGGVLGAMRRVRSR